MESDQPLSIEDAVFAAYMANMDIELSFFLIKIAECDEVLEDKYFSHSYDTLCTQIH